MTEKEYGFVKEAFEEETKAQLQEEFKQFKKLSNIEGTVSIKETEISIQFWGWELVLLEDGTYFINDTSGV